MRHPMSTARGCEQTGIFLPSVMAGLVPAIHVLAGRRRVRVDARHEAGHDGCGMPPHRAHGRTVRALSLLALLLTPLPAVAEARIDSVELHEGTCDASGAVALPEGSFGDRFLMVNNDDSFVRVYAVGTAGEPGASGPSLALRAPEDARRSFDIEAATWLDGEAIFVGSLSRDDDGSVEPDRWHFLSVAVDDEDGGDAVVRAGGSSNRLLGGLAALDDDLAAAIGDLDTRTADLAPGKAGINLEGLSVTADGAALFLGFRNPVPDGQSLLVKLLNPKAVLFEDAEPAFAAPMRLDLGGLGIRSMEYAPAAGVYFIVAGPIAEDGAFDIYRWVEGATPEPVTGARTALASLPGFRPEGLVIDQTGTRLQLFGAGDDCETDTFRSVVLTVS